MTSPSPSAPILELIYADAMTVLPALPDQSVDLIAADLPYAITELPWDARLPMEAMWAEFRRILTPTGAIVLLTAAQPFSADLVIAGRDLFKYACVWRKSPSGHHHAHSRPLCEHEDILVFSSGSLTSPSRNARGRRMTYNATGEAAGAKARHQRIPRAYNRTERDRTGETYEARRNVARSIIEVPRVARPFHPTQKPVALMRWIIETYSHPGDLILDPTMGSGTTGVAGVETGRDFVGIEADEKYFDYACSRIHEARMPLAA